MTRHRQVGSGFQDADASGREYHASHNEARPFLLSRIHGFWHPQHLAVEITCNQKSLSRCRQDLKRDFQIDLSGVVHRCWFDDISNSLRQEASSQEVSGDSRVSRALEQIANRHPPDVSFWISGFSRPNEDQLVELAKRINFYMRLYDPNSFTITVDPRSWPRVKQPLIESDSFPGIISAYDIPTYLLELWYASQEGGDCFRRFIESFRVLEYAKERLPASFPVADAMAPPPCPCQEHGKHEGKIEDQLRARSATKNPRLARMLCLAMGEDLGTWKTRRWIFNQQQTNVSALDLGLALRHTPRDARTIPESDVYNLIRISRRIRNAIVHSDDEANSIRPTTRNNEVLAEWLPVVNAMAMWAMDPEGQCKG